MINPEHPVQNDVSSTTTQPVEVVEDKQLQKEIFRTKRSYIPVELDKRQKLIQAVEEEGLTIKEAAQNLKINYSTAKHIVKVFKKTGEVQTQMMTKRLPERDIQSLEYLTFKQQPNAQSFNSQLEVQQPQTLLRHSYPMMSTVCPDIQTQQTTYKRLNLGDQLQYTTSANYYQTIQQQPQIAVQQLQSLIRQQQVSQLPQNGLALTNMNIALQNQLQNDQTQLVKPIPMNRPTQQIQIIQQQQPILIPQQNQLAQVQQINQLQILNQQYLEQVAARQMLLLTNGFQASGLTPSNQHQVRSLQHVQQQQQQQQQLTQAFTLQQQQQQQQQLSLLNRNALVSLPILNTQQQQSHQSNLLPQLQSQSTTTTNSHIPLAN